MAVKLIFKRSSLLGKRPTSAVIEPGEIALNTNSNEPGLFLEVSDGNVVKVGPTAVLPSQPTSTPALGELWYNTVDGTLNTGTVKNDQKVWASIAAPYLGGGGYVVFVAPEFPGSTDSIVNDGQALPFQTVARAVIELSKLTVNSILAGYSPSSENSKYTIYLAPSRVTVDNSPGVTADNFTVDFSVNPYQDVTTSQLVQFNTVDGGVVLPRGISIVGLDLKKCIISPTYVPAYKHPGYPAAQAGSNAAITSVFKWSGNTYLNNFSALDKIASRDVDKVSATSSTNPDAVFQSSRPHGLNFNDYVYVQFASDVNQSTGTFIEGYYYVNPINTFTFNLATGPLGGTSAPSYVDFTSLPQFSSGSQIKFIVTNDLYSAHRLRLVTNATRDELAQYYTKIQRAFPAYFGGKVTDGALLVSNGETVIVGPTDTAYPNNFQSNTGANSSAYANQVNLRSQYGMCWGDFDGNIISGFRSAVLNACTAVTLQNDPAAYEIYTTLNNPSTGLPELRWWTLVEATYLSYPLVQRPATIADTPVADQLALLNRTAIPNIRYYYSSVKNSDGKSYGIADINDDFRHFGFRAQNSGYLQAQSVYTVGAAVGVWALNGGQISLTNSTTNFGSVAFKSEGFYGINTTGGANANNSGFLFTGVQTPLSLTRQQVEDTRNKQILTLGSRILSVELDPTNPSIQLINLSSDFSPCFLLPFSLKPGSAVWVSTEQCTYRGFFATDGGPTVITGLNDPNSFATLRVRATDSTIPLDTTLIPQLGIPYIRRFRDPRSPFERSYSFVLKNTLPTAVSPAVGQVLRLNQSSQTLGNNTLKPNVQFDPGASGGWGRVFSVSDILTTSLGSSPQFNYVISDNIQDTSYYVTFTVTDYDRPWAQLGDTAQGSYITSQNKNWYAAENNIWDSVYYNTTFSSTVGPEKLAPVEPCSPFVASCALERQYVVADTYQGSFAGDPFATVYPTETYFRGATSPYTEYPVQFQWDEDDSSESMGVCLKDVEDVISTFTVTAINPAAVIQTSQQADQALNRRYRPEIIQFSVLSPIDLINPKQAVSIVTLSDAASPLVKEYLRVIGLNGSVVTAIRLNSENSLYPNPPSASKTWPIGTEVKPCTTNAVPAVTAYDPDWSNTKRSVLRFFEVMGYPTTAVEPLLTPRYWGERFIPVSFLPLSPSQDGYAAVTAEWPLEFNNPSIVQANTHTWAYCGYGNYSRGLPDYQTNNFPRKLSFDFLTTVLWSGSVSVSGTTETGENILIGPQREALTAQFYEQLEPKVQLLNQEIYEEQGFVEFPAQVVVYSVDDISSQFNGAQSVFDLKIGGIPVPGSQLATESTFVNLGAVTQIPTAAYTIANSKIQFSLPPQAGTVCDIRVVTSEDDQKTLETFKFTPTAPFDGVTSIFDFATTGATDSTVFDLRNLFVFLGGVEQLPNVAYNVTRINKNTIQLAFSGAPPVGLTYDVRCVTTGPYWANRLSYPVEVYSIDDISGQFNGAKKTFTLTYLGAPINPAVINTENLFISLGGAMQLPVNSYSVNADQITFTEAPLNGTTSNLRIVTNAEFLTCPQANGYGEFLRWGPGLVLSLTNELIAIDPGFVP